MPAKPNPQVAAQIADTIPAPGESPAERVRPADVFDWPAGPTFTFLARKDRLDVFVTKDGPEILPMLCPFTHLAGVNGVKEIKGAGGEGDPTAALGTALGQGWIVVPRDWEVIAFGQSVRGYCHQYKGAHGTITLTAWERLYKLGMGTQRVRDPDGYHAFLRRVRDELLLPLDPGVVRGLKAKLTADLSRAQVKAGDSAGAARSVPALRGKLSVFDPPPPAAPDAA